MSTPDEHESTRLRALGVAAVAMLPIALSWIHKVLVHPRQFYAFYFDPETIYFYEGSRLLHGISPVNVDNPGTPLQLLSAAIELFTTEDPLQLDRFRLIAYVVALIAKFVAAYGLSPTLLRNVPPMLQVVAIWTFFLAPHALEYDVVWSPECWYFVAGAAVVALIARYVEMPSARTAFVAAAMIGVALALKLTFLAFLPALAVAAIATRRGFAAAAAGVVAGFVTATLPIVNRYGDTFGFFSKTAASQGASPFANVRRAIAFLPLWHIWLALLIVVAIAATRRARKTNVVIAIVAILATYTLAAPHLQLRYLMLSGIAAMLLAAAAFDARSLRWTPTMQVAIFVLAAGLLIPNLLADARRHDERILNTERLRATVQRFIAAQPVAKPVTIYAWHYPAPSFALRALAFAPRYWSRIDSAFPRDGHYDVWSHQWHLPQGARRWDFLVVNITDLHQVRGAGVPRAQVGEYVIVQNRR